MKVSIVRTTFYLLIIGIAMCAYTVNPAYSEEFKMGYVDSQKALDESLSGKQVKDALQEYVQSRQKIVDIEETELRKLQEDISKQSAVLSQEARQEKEDMFQKKFMEYQKKVGELQKEIQQRRNEKLEEFNVGLDKIVKAIGEKEDFSIILNNLEVNIVLYAKPSLNLTDRVIAELDKNIKTGDKKDNK